MVENKPVARFGQKKAVAELHLRPGFAANDHMQVALVKAQYLFRIGDLALSNDAFVRLTPGVGQLLKHVVSMRRRITSASLRLRSL